MKQKLKQRVAIIELGSNSAKLLIAEFNTDNTLNLITDDMIITQASSGMAFTKSITDSAITNCINAIKQFQNRAKILGANRTEAVATMFLRNAKNSDFFIKRVKTECGITIKQLSNKEEAKLSFEAALSGIKLNKQKLTVFDSGGASSEYIEASNKEILKIKSIDIGARTLTEQYCQTYPVSDKNFLSICGFIEKKLAQNKINRFSGQLIGQGGSVTNMAAIKLHLENYDPQKIHGTLLNIKEVIEQVYFLKSLTLQELNKISGIGKERAKIILAGSIIVWKTMECLCPKLIVSTQGIRHALAERILLHR